MITDIDPKILLIVGFVLVIVGFILPALMIMQILESTFFLNFLAYIASILGMMLGIIGSITYVRRHRK